MAAPHETVALQFQEIAVKCLAQFLEFHPEDVVQIQATRQFTRDVAIPRPACVQVHLLQQQQIGLDRLKEVEYLRKLQSALDVPAQNAKEISRPRPRRTEPRSTTFGISHWTFEPG